MSDITANTEHLAATLTERQSKINSGLALLAQTKDLFDRFGGQVFASTYDKFATLAAALSSSELRMAVIGEFSRGKSSLLNALLGMEQLPTAQDATTAINTFIYGLPEGEETPFIEIFFNDGSTQRIEITSKDQSELRRWGTELDESGKADRSNVDHIELHMHHPLLDLGLVLIDTPGLRSIQAHHEAITHRAIDSAHIALWVQCTDQLGGNRDEWNFLKDTIRKSFRKFITVINKWDKVLEPTDAYDKSLPQADRERKKLSRVQHEFEVALDTMPEDQLQALIGPDNLFGVSAAWALSGEADKVNASNIRHLARRISEMCSSADAMDEIFYKPVSQLAHMQEVLEKHLNESVDALQNSDSLEKLRRDLEQLQSDIKNIEAEIKIINAESRDEHNRLHGHTVQKLKKDLLEPINNLKNEILGCITLDYVQKAIAKKQDHIGLPNDLQERFDNQTNDINAKIASQRDAIAKTLEDLRLDYTKSMEKYVDKISGSLSTLNIEMPVLNVQCHMDFGEIEEFYVKKQDLENQLREQENKLDEIDSEQSQYIANEAALAIARDAVRRAQEQVINLGSAPNPIRSTSRHKVSDGGMYSSPKYETREHVDYTPVEKWREAQERLLDYQQDKEAELQKIVADEQRKTQKRMSLDQARRKYERHLKKLEEDLRKQEAAAQNKARDLAKDTYDKLLRRTAGQLEKYGQQLENNVIAGVRSIFDNHLKFLMECVNSQYTEMLKSKESAKSEAAAVLAQGENEKQARLAELHDALGSLAALKAETAKYCES